MAVLKQIFALLFLAILVAECVSFAIESRSAFGGTALEAAREAPVDLATPLDPVAADSGAQQPLERETRGLKKKKKKSKKSHKKHGKKGHSHGGSHGGYHG